MNNILDNLIIDISNQVIKQWYVPQYGRKLTDPREIQCDKCNNKTIHYWDRQRSWLCESCADTLIELRDKFNND